MSIAAMPFSLVNVLKQFETVCNKKDLMIASAVVAGLTGAAGASLVII